MIGDDTIKVRFLDPKETKYVQERINNDPKFHIAAKFMSEDVLIGVGDFYLDTLAHLKETRQK